jgi:hypothetical protein
MRLFHLIGLASLASLVGASLTPVDSRLIMHTNNAFLDPAHQIKATNNDCVKLPRAVYKNMHSIQMSGKRCAFYKADECTGEALLWLNAGTHYVRIDIDHYKKYAVYTAAVKCEDSATEWASDIVDAPEKRDALASKSLTLFSEPRFQGQAYEIKAMATDKCAKLPEPVSKNLRSLQVTGQRCSFMEMDDCKGTALFTAYGGSDRPLHDDLDRVPNADHAHRAVAVVCSDLESPGDGHLTVAPSEKRQELPDDPDELPEKLLAIYAEDYGQGVPLEIDATNRCVKLDASVYKNVHSYVVADQICHFMDTDKCDGKVIITVNAQGTELMGRVDVHGQYDNAGRITSVYCGERAPVESRTIQTPGYNPGVVRACTYAKKRETCQQVNALESCQNFADNIAEKIDTLKQGGYSECKYWRNKGCSSLIVTSLSGPQDYSPNLGPGNKDGHEMHSVSCKRQAKVNAEVGSTIHADEDFTISKRGGPQAGQVLVADGPNLAGITRLVDTTIDDNNCAPLTNQLFWHLVSLTQYQGSVCTYWQYN